MEGGGIALDEFDLVILPEYLKRRCKVIWRQQDKLGVEFAKIAALSATSPGNLKRAGTGSTRRR